MEHAGKVLNVTVVPFGSPTVPHCRVVVAEVSKVPLEAVAFEGHR